MQHILFFAGYRMKVFGIGAGIPHSFHTFDPGQQGFADFENYLNNHIRKPVRLLLDIIEEDFHLDQVPHVIGRDKKGLHQRLLNKYFRDSEHRYIKTQGRVEGNRRDDQVLVSGVSNSELLKPWLNLLDKHHIALAGIHSLPLTAEQILKHLNITDSKVLLVSQQVPSCVRHSLYIDGKLKLSRLAQALGNESETPSQVALHELSKTVRFLENQRNINVSEKELKLHYLGSETVVSDLVEEIERQGQKSILKSWEIHSLGEGQVYADLFYSEYLALRRWPENHYGHDQNLRIYYHKLASIGLNIAAATMLCISVITSIWLVWQERYEREAIPRLIESAQSYLHRYDAQTGELSELNIEAKDVKISVDELEQLSIRYGQRPQYFMDALAKVKEDFPELSYQRIRWYVPEQRSDLDRLSASNINAAPFNATVEAQFADSGDSPRKALALADALLMKLSKVPGFKRVHAIKMPFDLGSNTQFQMDNRQIADQAELKKASFSFRIIGALP